MHLLRIEPRQLNFFHTGDGNPAFLTIHLHNDTREHVAFRVRASDPNRFRAAPPRGRIDPGANIDMIVTILGQVEAPRFHIESIAIDPGETEERIRMRFNNQRHMVGVNRLRVVLGNMQQQNRDEWHAGDLLRRVFVVALSCVIFLYILVQILSHLWSSFVSAMTMSFIQAIETVVTNYAQEWMKRNVLVLCLSCVTFVTGLVVHLFRRWVELVLSDIDHLSRFVYQLVLG